MENTHNDKNLTELKKELYDNIKKGKLSKSEFIISVAGIGAINVLYVLFMIFQFGFGLRSMGFFIGTGLMTIVNLLFGKLFWFSMNSSSEDQEVLFIQIHKRINDSIFRNCFRDLKDIVGEDEELLNLIPDDERIKTNGYSALLDLVKNIIRCLENRKCKCSGKKHTDELDYNICTLEELERKIFQIRLDQNNWNVSKTARSLGTSRSNLYKKIKHYGLKEKKNLCGKK